jgi:excisionase family DNA binding protein
VTNSNEQRLRTKKEAAKFLGVSEPTIDRFRNQGNLPFVKIGIQVRFTDADLADFVTRCRIERRSAGYASNGSK